jgi:hypothetical protein
VPLKHKLDASEQTACARFNQGDFGGSTTVAFGIASSSLIISTSLRTLPLRSTIMSALRNGRFV